MTISRKKFIEYLLLAALCGAFVCALIFGGVLHAGGRTVVSSSSYEKAEQTASRYASLSAIENAIDEQGLYQVDSAARETAVLRAAAKSTGDPYTEYLTKKEADKFRSAVNGSVQGIGVLFAQQGSDIVVDEVTPKSPAQAAGLKRGDRIVAVNGEKYTSLHAVRIAVSGKADTKVRITYERNGVKKSVTASRAAVSAESVYSRVLSGRIGYLHILSFQKDTGTDFATELKSLENQRVNGVIIDLRGNGGGYISQAVNVADQLLSEGTIARVNSRKKGMRYYNSDENRTSLQYVLLVDEDTASASELLAAAVKENGGGKVIGETTYGKGVIQKMISFSDGSALRLTTREFFSPQGHRINGKGVTPDIEVNSNVLSRARDELS